MPLKQIGKNLFAYTLPPEPVTEEEKTQAAVACARSASLLVSSVMWIDLLGAELEAIKKADRRGQPLKVGYLKKVIRELSRDLNQTRFNAWEAFLPDIRQCITRLYWPTQIVDELAFRLKYQVDSPRQLVALAIKVYGELLTHRTGLTELAAELDSEFRIRCLKREGLTPDPLAVELPPGDAPRARKVKVLGAVKSLPSDAAMKLVTALVERGDFGIALPDAKKIHTNASAVLNALAKEDADWRAALDLPNNQRTGYRIRRWSEAQKARAENGRSAG